MKYGIINNWIDGKFTECDKPLIDVVSPVTGEVIAQTVISDATEVDIAVEAAKKAQESWGKLSIKSRAEVMYNYRNLLATKYKEELAQLNHEENGKTMGEALAGVAKAVELVEVACAAPSFMVGETEEVSRGVTCRTELRPTGIVASITPFNFPVMVPHWSAPMALVCGNATILKPACTTPLSCAKIAEIFKEAGLPDGLFSVINGERDAVRGLCDNPSINAVTFVGSTPVAKIVYERAAKSLKKVLALGGAKNYLILMPDAHPEMAARDIIASFSGMSGQRCMAASVLVCVDNCDSLLARIIELVKEQVPGIDIPPIHTTKAATNIRDYITNAEKLGAKLLVDGRATACENAPAEFCVGSSIIDWRGKEELMPEEEIFGPTLEILAAKNLNEALDLHRSSPYGNAAAIFTQSGAVAEAAIKGMASGMLGVNIGIPVPRDPFSFGGLKESKFGSGDVSAKYSHQFYTNTVKVTTKWNPEDKVDWMS